MGWNFGSSGKKALVKELCQEYATTRTLPDQSTMDVTVRTLDHRMVGNNLWRVAEVRHVNDDSLVETYVVLHKIMYDARDESWGYKTIGEHSGPFECNCPLMFLSRTRLRVIATDESILWRQRVVEYHAQRNYRGTWVKSIVPGDVIESRAGLVNSYTKQPAGTEWRVIEVLNKGAGRFCNRRGFVVENKRGFRCRMANRWVVGKLHGFTPEPGEVAPAAASVPDDANADPGLRQIHDGIAQALLDQVA